jgi:hypothetical protein
MSKEPRQEKFKIGQLHGKLRAENEESEAHIQRTVFLSQRLKLCRAKDDFLNPMIRIFGYEIPLRTGCSRGECVDLMGYDSDHNLYLIELKKENSNEQIKKIAEQINGYEKDARKILPQIEDDFKNEFFFRISFKEIKKIVLAPREFYKEKKRKREALVGRDTIEYAYFRDKSIYKHKLKNIISIHLVEK